MYLRDEETIVAQCTPLGSGALALIRLSGLNAIVVTQRIAILAQQKQLEQQPSHTIHVGWIVNEQKENLDHVLFLLMRAPATFTGHDTVEITCHNNQLIIEAIINRAIQAGARLASAGEFTRRAYLNGKIDLMQAEAVADLIHAHSEQALKKSLAQVEGSFSHWVVDLEQSLIKTLAWVEASFEFLDEGGDFAPQIQENITAILSKIATLQNSHQLQKYVQQGVRVALVGSVNVGKSSLFNMLLGHKRAIVSPQAGTTRDSIEAGFIRQGVNWTLIDTAGLRQTADIIEQEGIERSLQEAHQADVVLLVYDGTLCLTVQEEAIYQRLIAEYSHKIIRVINKVDVPSACTAAQISADFACYKTSCSTKQGFSELEHELEHRIASLLQTHQAPFLINKRHYQVLERLKQNLKGALQHLWPCAQYELLACIIKDALEQVSELTGKSVDEAVLDAVFKEFCVGK